VAKELEDFIENTYCAGCLKTATFALVTYKAQQFYVCIGEPRHKRRGCGKIVEYKGKPEERPSEHWD
jgi:hypothetical protein